MMYLAGLSYKVIGGVLAVAIPLILLLLFLITQTDFQLPEPLDSTIGYQLDRIRTWNDPDAEENSNGAIQQNNSITAIGSGQLTGKGLNNNKVSSANKGNFVAEIHNDFIFAVAGEELGFIGCCAIILILSLIVFQCIRIGRRAKDEAGNADRLRGRYTGGVPELSEHRSRHRNPSEHRHDTAVCQLWADVSLDIFYRDGTCTQRRTSES